MRWEDGGCSRQMGGVYLDYKPPFVQENILVCFLRMKGDFFYPLRVNAVIWEGKFLSDGICASLGTQSSNDNLFTQSKKSSSHEKFHLN